MSYESVLNLLHREYGRPVSFIYESQGLCTIHDDASFRTCINHVRSNFEKRGVSTPSRLEAFILELDQIPRKSRTLQVGSKDARDKGTESYLGDHLRRPTDVDASLDWSSAERVGSQKHQTSKALGRLRSVTKSASSIPEHGPRLLMHGKSSRTSWDFEARFRQIDALMGQPLGAVDAKGNSPEKKVELASARTAAVQIERVKSSDLQAVDAAEAQVSHSHDVYRSSCEHFRRKT